MARVLGARFLDRQGRELPPGGASLLPSTVSTAGTIPPRSRPAWPRRSSSGRRSLGDRRRRPGRCRGERVAHHGAAMSGRPSEHRTAVLERGEGRVQASCSCGWRSAIFGADKRLGAMDALQQAADAVDLHEWDASLP
jgi:hypothetical protein